MFERQALALALERFQEKCQAVFRCGNATTKNQRCHEPLMNLQTKSLTISTIAMMISIQKPTTIIVQLVLRCGERFSAS